MLGSGVEVISMQRDPHALQIFIDGSCLMHEGRRSGYAGYVLRPDGSPEEQITFRGFKHGTNNRAELSACIAALEWVREERPSVGRVQIFSDSLYLIDNIPRASYWQKNKWRNAAGRPIEHADQWKEFLAARSKAAVRVDFGWEKGKADALRKKVDQAAKQAARAGTNVDHGLIVGKIGRARTKGGSATMFQAGGQVLAIRVYASRVVGKTKENFIKFEIYDEATQLCGAKHFAYAQPAVGAELHRQRAFQVQMNDNPAYPQIMTVLGEIPLPPRNKDDFGESKGLKAFCGVVNISNHSLPGAKKTGRAHRLGLVFGINWNQTRF
jgi:ribonuclease HI